MPGLRFGEVWLTVALAGFDPAVTGLAAGNVAELVLEPGAWPGLPVDVRLVPPP